MAKDDKEEETWSGPSFYGERMRLFSFSLPQFMRDWLLERPEGAAATLRDLIQREMEKESKND